MTIEGNSVHVVISTVWLEYELPEELPFKRTWYKIKWMDTELWYITILFELVYFVSKATNDDGEHLLIQSWLPYYDNMDHYNMYSYEYWFYDDELEPYATAIEWVKSL